MNIRLLSDWISFGNIEKYKFNIECNVCDWLCIKLMEEKKKIDIRKSLKWFYDIYWDLMLRDMNFQMQCCDLLNRFKNSEISFF